MASLSPVPTGLLVAAVFSTAGAAAAFDIPAGWLSRTDMGEADRLRVESVVRPADRFAAPEAFEAMAGGAGTSTRPADRNAFSHIPANLAFERHGDFHLGNALFGRIWAPSPSSTQASDGLGPLFNARSCLDCHVRDGRGRPPEAGERPVSMVLRLARAPGNAAERQAVDSGEALNFPDPVYGVQLQEKSLPGLKAEGRMTVRYREIPVTLGDGKIVSLRQPDYGVEGLAWGPLHRDAVMSARIAQPLIGLGLVEAIHEADLLALADPEDADGDGISGRLQIVRDPETGRPAAGRFGWKAENASLRVQTASAFANDIGISTPLIPRHHGDCTAAQPECLAKPDGFQQRLGDSEAPDPVLDLVTFYAANLAVPARRGAGDKQVLAGKRLFHETGCVACHVPKFVTRRDAAQAEHAFQLIWPWSDFLLHDMGEGLADGQQAGKAGGREWRTPPLWGIGLTRTVDARARFLHDGRARDLVEAILWHGGEAQAARDAFAKLERQEREALVRFLESL